MAEQVKVYASKDGRLVNLSKVTFIEPEFLIAKKKYVIIFMCDANHRAWQYDTAEERDAELKTITSLWLK